MSLLFSIDRSTATREVLGEASGDPRALRILAKTIYRELRQSGLVEEDLMSVAGELLSLVAGDVKNRRQNAESLDGSAASRVPQAR
jgi:hypothetical protein